MKPIEPISGFDCLEFKRKVQEEIYEQIKSMTHEEEIAYFRQKVENGPFAKWWKRVQAKTPPNTGHQQTQSANPKGIR